MLPSRSASMMRFSGQFTYEPQLCESPVAFDGIRGDVQRLGRFLNAQSAEKPELHDPALPRVNHLERAKCVVERHQILLWLGRDDERLVERDLRQAAAALLVVPC